MRRELWPVHNWLAVVSLMSAAMLSAARRAVWLGVALLVGCGVGCALEGPTLEYRLDEGKGDLVQDRAGAHDGYVAQPLWVSNGKRAALRFDGRHTVVTVEDAGRLKFPTALSAALWFRAARVDRSDPLGLIVKSPTFRLLVYPRAQKFLIDVHGAPGRRIYESPPAPMKPDTWHHVALTYAAGGAGVALYLDGAPVFERPLDIGGPAAGEAPIRIGVGVNLAQRRYFKGILANVKLWERALSAREVQQIVNTERPELAGTFRGPDDLAPQTDTTVLYEVGDRKQLFIDRRFIESARGVTLAMNPPTKLGPVLLPERPWENLRIGFCDSVMEHEGTYKLFYSAMARGKGTFVCLATSTDGEHWHRPNLGVVQFNGSTQNNIVMSGVGETVVFLDPHGTPAQRFKAVSLRHWPDPDQCGLYVPTSPDGIHWTTSSQRLFPLGPDTANQALWDTQRGKYVAFIRLWNPLRKVGRIEMDDIMEPWPYRKIEKPYYIWGEDKIAVPSKEVPTAFEYDDRDPVPSDHYNAAAVEYPWAADAYFMFPSAYLHFPDPPAGQYANDGLLDIQLAVSRTGVKFQRLSREPYVPLSPEAAKDSKCLYMAVGMVRRGDYIYQYYAGYEITHGAPQQAGPNPIGSICALRQRLDGFISADAAYTGGELLTPPLKFAGDHLELNVDCSALGSCQVGVLDRAGEPFPGFGAGACDEIHGNHISKTVSWQGKSDVSSLAGETVRLHFLLRACKLYAFQFAVSR